MVQGSTIGIGMHIDSQMGKTSSEGEIKIFQIARKRGSLQQKAILA